jgi:DNA-binding transcriptional LysR family regulator
MQIEDLDIALDVARSKSFAQTARDRNMDPSNVTRAVARLEDRLGFQLFQRSTRRVNLTEKGQQYLDQIAPLLTGLQEAERAAQAQILEPEGQVRLTCSAAFGQEVLLPLLPKFRAEFPRIELKIYMTDDNMPLLERQIDLALRFAPTPRGNMHATKLLSPIYQCVGSRTWQGKINRPQDLAGADCLVLDLPPALTPWHFVHANTKESCTIDAKGTLSLSAPLAVLKAACAGHGPTLLPDWLVKEALETKDLVNLLPNWRGQMHEAQTHLWLLHHPHRHMPLTIRLVRDFLINHISEQ